MMEKTRELVLIRFLLGVDLICFYVKNQSVVEVNDTDSEPKE